MQPIHNLLAKKEAKKKKLIPPGEMPNDRSDAED
jgi:hypothetical protein